MVRIIGFWLALLSAVAFAAPATAQVDRKGCQDYPAISRMPGSFIAECTAHEFDAASFPVMENGKAVPQRQEGRYFRLKYYLKKDAPVPSMLQVIRNFQNAAKSAGGEVLSDRMGSNWASTTLKLSLAGKDVWVLVETRTTEHTLTIVEKEPMQQQVTINAAAMRSAIGETGKIALYGIYFDTAKSTLKPESEPTLAEIAKLLADNPTLNVFIVGHTDMVGGEAYNVKLSQARAQAVISALASRYGVVAGRMKPFGAGPYAPIASNRTEDGRAKNRRVELVEIATQ